MSETPEGFEQYFDRVDPPTSVASIEDAEDREDRRHIAHAAWEECLSRRVPSRREGEGNEELGEIAPGWSASVDGPCPKCGGSGIVADLGGTTATNCDHTPAPPARSEKPTLPPTWPGLAGARGEAVSAPKPERRTHWIGGTDRKWDFYDADEMDAYLERAEAELAEAKDKALRFDLDQAGITQREKEAVELVELRADLAAERAKVEALGALTNHYHDCLECAEVYEPGCGTAAGLRFACREAGAL